MCFELLQPSGSKLSLYPYYYRSDYAGVEQWSRFDDDDGEHMRHARLLREHETFAALWDRNLRIQGFLLALTDESIRG